MSTTTRLKATRYRIHGEIGRGNMGIVYRAIDRMNGEIVALKEVTTTPDRMSFESRTIAKDSEGYLDLRVALAREFGTLASLRHPNIISVLDYGFDAGQPYYTMEYLKNPKTILEEAKKASFFQKINLLAQMMHALVYLHRRGIIHRDLKPENVLVVGGHVKILDFGLAIAQSKQQEGVAGTIAYIAPEVLSGHQASMASDMYAAGIITYELLAGRHPFDDTDINALIAQTMRAEPKFDNLDIDERLEEAIKKMLAKKPADRFQDASDVLEIFAQVTNIPVQLESSMMRESFLEAAEFIGREEEKTQLTQALKTVSEAYTGSAWLIGGESGVGKSRLLEEVRTRALVQGMVVLRGQSVEEENVAYALWRDPLRALCLATSVQPDEARVLRLVLPDIAELLDITLDDDDKKPQQTVRDLLFDVVESLFRRHEEPTLLVLEDLQWASDSLFLLQRLTQFVNDLPLVIMASFRSEERPDLPETLPDMNLIALERLTPKQIAELSASMLGDDVGRNSDILVLLEQETEGNVLFIVEVVRTLAERAGQLGQIAHKTLPHEIFSGSIQSVVQRRLKRLPEEMLSLLRIAAVSGRQPDIRILEHLKREEYSLDSWLTMCSNAAVLEIKQEKWRFVHDKIRTALISMMDDNQIRSTHAQIAEALEDLSAGDKVKENTRIAYHWENAGQLARAILYLVRAAEQALRDYASENVVQYLDKAIGLERTLSNQDLPTHVTKEQRAHWERILGEATDGMGDHEESKRHYMRVLDILDPDGSGTTISDYSKLHNNNVPEMTEEQADALYACERLLRLYLNDGQWSSAEAIITRMSTIYFGIGDQRSWISTLVTTAWIDYFQGNFTGAERGFKQSFTIGRLRKLPTMVTSGGAGLLMVISRKTHENALLEKSLKELETTLSAIEREPESEEKLLLAGTRAFTHLQLGQIDKARERTREGLSYMTSTPRSYLFDLVAYTSVAETLLDLWEAGYRDEQLKADIQRACKAVHIFAQVVPIARPRAWIYQGRCDEVLEKPERAMRALKTAVTVAQQLNMPYDEGIAYYRLGIHATADDPELATYIEIAIQRFEDVGAVEQLRSVKHLQEEKLDDKSEAQTTA